MNQTIVDTVSETAAVNVGSNREECPYVGLKSFSEDKADYFFGRTRDIEIVTMNLRASRFTILYGESGVGKSSMLSAGVVPRLKKLSTLRALPDQPPYFLPVILREWSSNPIESLEERIKQIVLEAVADKKFPNLSVEEVENRAFRTGHANSVDEMLQKWTAFINTKLLIILDQFEDFFLHPELFAGADSFGEQFPLAVNNINLPVNFMLSLRDDTLAKLDFFKGKIHEPMNNTLRLHHLNRASAEEAIRKPIKKYNAKWNENFDIKSDLVEQILNDLRLDRIKPETRKQAESKTKEVNDYLENINSNQISAPFLQLVLKRLWEHDDTQSTKWLSKETLTKREKLGGVEKIIETHVAEALNQFDSKNKNLIADFIHFTITRNGDKRPLSADDLLTWAELERNFQPDDIERILRQLSGENTRIFKSVQNPVDTQSKLYEISHDALAPAIISWRKQHQEKRSLEESYKLMWKKFFKRLAFATFLIAFGVLLVSVQGWFTAATLKAQYEAETAQREAKEARDKAAEAERNAEDLETIYKNRDTKNLEFAQSLALLASPDQEKKKEGADKLDQLINKENIEIPEELRLYILGLLEAVNVNEAKPADSTPVLRVRQALRKPAPSLSDDNNPDKQLQPLIYIHILSEEQRSGAKNIEKLLESNKHIVPKIILVPNIRLNNTQIRYFREFDSFAAGEVSKLLTAKGVKNVQIQYMSGYENSGKIRSRLEIWFASEAFVSNSGGSSEDSNSNISDN